MSPLSLVSICPSISTSSAMPTSYFIALRPVCAKHTSPTLSVCLPVCLRVRLPFSAHLFSSRPCSGPTPSPKPPSLPPGPHLKRVFGPAPSAPADTVTTVTVVPSTRIKLPTVTASANEPAALAETHNSSSSLCSMTPSSISSSLCVCAQIHSRLPQHPFSPLSTPSPPIPASSLFLLEPLLSPASTNRYQSVRILRSSLQPSQPRYPSPP